MASHYDYWYLCGIGGLFYMAISLKSKLAHRLFGSRIECIAKKIKIEGLMKKQGH